MPNPIPEVTTPSASCCAAKCGDHLLQEAFRGVLGCPLLRNRRFTANCYCEATRGLIVAPRVGLDQKNVQTMMVFTSVLNRGDESCEISPFVAFAKPHLAGVARLFGLRSALNR